MDVAIIGGGPAGSAAALTLLKHTGFSVAVFERSSYSAWRVGETLPPGVRPLLEYLDAWETFAGQGYVPAHGTCAAWGGSELVARDFLFTARGHGWHLDRRMFDRTLADLVVERGGASFRDANVELQTGNHAECWRLIATHGQPAAMASVSARFVIDASGKQAWFARRRGARRIVRDQLVGLVGLCEFPGSTLRDSFTLVEACT